MESFQYAAASSADDAIKKYNDTARYIAGGTTLIDLMKLEVERPKQIIDVNPLPFQKIESIKDGHRVGAFVKNSALALDNAIVKGYPALSQALLAGASAQIRNKASVSGNLLQKTRCVYFRDPHKPCNKRNPGSGCSALEGFNRNLAVMGTSESCIASNPSDMNVALTSLEAEIETKGPKGERKIPIRGFYLLPGKTPEVETQLLPGELIQSVRLKSPAANTKALYLKLRDRASYEFALASAAVNLTMEGKTIRRARLAMGGIGTIPWYSQEAEQALEGKEASEDNFRKAADLMLNGAKAQSQNAFKIQLAKNCLVQTLRKTSEG